MTARRILDGIVRNVYKQNTGKTAAWTSASHIEKIRRKRKLQRIRKKYYEKRTFA
jgi:hypothetical protein